MQDNKIRFDLPEITADEMLMTRILADAAAEQSPKGIFHRGTILQLAAMAASLMIGVWWGAQDASLFTNALSDTQDAALIADFDVFSAELTG